MSKNMKKIIIISFIIITLAGAGYGAYKAYHYIIQDATERIKKGVKKGIGSALNPIKWFR